ncbi:AAA family ATPase [Oceanospirillum linum]|uniref:ATP-binding protein n=1 Tax=Oceanospirillum linum TaxID=966 RepID=A0A1T1HCI6_OCELI|nr:AAA family ATPase [Oceanospirillum linum]OOV87427.1 ATP-binding protein [Oceanospirillum linum]
MKIENLRIENFRRFESLEIDFHPELTVIIAQNGQGKTSLLDACSIALGTFVGAFDFGRSKHIEVKDARYKRLPNSVNNEQQFPVKVSATYTDPALKISRQLNGLKSRTTVKDAESLTHHGKQLGEKVRELEQATLPVMAYFGAGRLWITHKNASRKSVLSTSRTMGYEDCLSSASNFKQMQQWMMKATYAALQQREMGGYETYNLSSQLTAVKNTVDKILETAGWSNFHYSMSHEELAMQHEELGILPVSMLSDGVRAMVSLAADLSWRCVKLNPHLGVGAPLQTEGIVMLDEVDMHLHPEWQQTVIHSLRTAFPKVQFIVTTHSPQVLSTVPKECIRLIGNNAAGQTIASEPLAFSYGEPSGDILQSIMQVDPQPPVPEKKMLDELTSLVDQGEYKSPRADELLEELSARLNERHPQLGKIRRSIRRQEALNG